MNNVKSDYRGTPKREPWSRFTLGQWYATPGALQRLSHEEMLHALGCHARADWGDVDDEDWKANDRALIRGGRLVSVYRSRGGVKFYVISEADRSATTVLLPEEY